LDSLGLSGNQIRDIKPLAELHNLRILHLDRNQISDISPLASLSELSGIYLDKNQISDVKPLVRLTKLRSIELRGNQIKDLKSLIGLSNKFDSNGKEEENQPIKYFFGSIELQDNPIVEKVCPVRPVRECKF
jgi:internalin A